MRLVRCGYSAGTPRCATNEAQAVLALAYSVALASVLRRESYTHSRVKMKMLPSTPRLASSKTRATLQAATRNVGISTE
eukprot:6174269-Pleurochrysis_carterae.AAC.2